MHVPQTRARTHCVKRCPTATSCGSASSVRPRVRLRMTAEAHSRDCDILPRKSRRPDGRLSGAKTTAGKAHALTANSPGPSLWSSAWARTQRAFSSSGWHRPRHASMGKLGVAWVSVHRPCQVRASKRGSLLLQPIHPCQWHWFRQRQQPPHATEARSATAHSATARIRRRGGVG